MIELAELHVDVGLYTHNEAEMLAFWGHSVGLPHEQTIELQWPARQQIFGANGTCIRVNAVREPMEPAPPGGYRRLLIARRGLREVRELADPDGNLVTLVPPGTDRITSVMIELAVRDEDEFKHFYQHTIGLEEIGKNTFRCGDSLLRFHAREDAIHSEVDLRAPGYRYFTMRVSDVDATHAGLLDRGAAEARAPYSPGRSWRVSFVLDPDGNWVELFSNGPPGSR